MRGGARATGKSDEAILRVLRDRGATPDAWDRRPAVVLIDGVERDELHIGDEAEFTLALGAHEFGIRLQYYFAPAKLTVQLRRREVTIVTCSKGSATFLDLLQPGRYWDLTATTDTKDGR